MGNGGGEGCGNRVEEKGVAIGWGMVEERVCGKVTTIMR